MRKSFCTTLCLLITLFVYSQDLLKSRKTSYQTFVYKLTEKEARKVYSQHSWKVDTSYFHTLVDTYPTDSLYQPRLNQGHYLKVYVDGSELKLDILTIQDFEVEILNNSTDLNIRVFQKTGEAIKHAKVRVGIHHLNFDKKTETYRCKKTNTDGKLSVSLNGFTTFYDLERQINNSIGKRLLHGTVYKTPVKYVWIPVVFALKIPIDGTKSLIRWYPQGTISRIVYHSKKLYFAIACQFDEYYCDRYSRYTSKYLGYMVFNQPKYLPTDSIKFKAFLTKKGKPINDNLDIILSKSYDENVKLTSLEPYRKGAYHYSFLPSDSLDLKLDRFYTIELQNESGKTLYSGRFRYEEYELGKTKLNVHVPNSKQFRGQDAVLEISGTDENGLNLLDARLKIQVSSLNVSKYCDSKVYVPNELYRLEKRLEPEGVTKISIPDTLFPKANLTYRVSIDLLTSDNERLSKSEDLEYIHELNEIDFSLQNDSLRIQYLVNNSSEAHEATISGFSGFNELIEKRAVILPVTIPINPYFRNYTVKSNDLTVSLDLSGESSLLSFETGRVSDSLFISSVNPRKIPFVYYLYKTNKEKKRGNGKSLILNKKARSNRNYYLSIQYLWGGETHTENFEISKDKNLNITIDAPTLIYPGQKAELTVKVTDPRGKPVPSADLTVHGLTSKFHFEPPSLPQFEKPEKSRSLFNSFTLEEQDPYFQKRKNYDFQSWNPLAGLDSIEYFKFLFPGDRIYTYEYLPGNGVTQFAPFILKSGFIQPISAVFVDRIPVYLSWSNDQPYSFKLDSGYHHIRILCRSIEYTIEKMHFNHGNKLIFSFDLEHLPKTIEAREKTDDQMKAQEVNLQKYLLIYKNTHFEPFGYFDNLNRYFALKPESKSLIGPITNSSLSLHIFDKFSQSFLHEPFYEFEIQKGLVKMRCIDLKKKLTPLSQNPFIWNFSDEILTLKKMKEEWEAEILFRRINSRRYANPHSTKEGMGLLIVDSPVLDSLNDQTLNTLLFSQEDASFLRVYPCRSSHFHDLNGGNYRAIYLLENGNYLQVDSIHVKSSGKNWITADVLTSNKKDEFSIKLNSLMDIYFQSQMGNPLNPGEEEKIRREYQKQYQYFGEGDVISGYVYDEVGSPIPGANVLAKGTTYGTITDLEGYYTLRIPYSCDKLIYSFIGYAPEEKDINTSVSFDIHLEPDIHALEEVVVVGYGLQKSSNLTASVSQVQNTLAGKVAGVQIGEPLPKIRGNSSLNNGETPLYVIDGIPFFGNLSTLDPSIFSNATILKGEEALAIYGSQAANGVVLLSTGAKVSNQQPYEWSEFSNINSIRDNFSDEAFWKPNLKTNEHGIAGFEVTFPDDITKWETFAYAVSHTGNVGQSRFETKSFKPLSAQLSLPRFLLAGDSSFAIGKSFNYLLDSAKISTSFKINNETKQVRSTTFKNSTIDTLQLFPVGTDSLEIQFSLDRVDGYFDGEKRSLPVFPVGVEKSVGSFGVLRKDTTVKWEFNNDLGPVTLFATAKSTKLLTRNIQYLINYPYECNEQLASKLKALLISKNLHTEFELKSSRDREINQVIRKLADNQGEDGLWGWWNTSNPQIWVSLHIAEALALAKRTGYRIENINTDAIADHIAWQLTSREGPNSKLELLYLASVLELKFDVKTFMQDIDITKLNMGQKLRFQQIQILNGIKPEILWIKDSLQTDLLGGQYLETQDRCFYSNVSLQWTTMAYQVLQSDSLLSQTAEVIEDYLLKELSGSSMYNTFHLSNMLEALAPRLTNYQTSITPELFLNGDLEAHVTSFPYTRKIENPEMLSLTQQGSIPIYINAYQTIWETNPAIEKNQFSITTAFEDNSSKLEGGKPVKLIAEVKVLADAEYVIIEIPIPGGSSYGNKENNYYKEVHREYFKEKVSIFCERLSHGTYKFEVNLLPRYSGSYALNPAKVELMYFPVIHAHEGLKRIEIE